ncbi:hypothetical protein LTR62_003835 [Meristemomyces frigidus]|uniref:Inositol polyphosphate-related phosphatase domain-containing protein n=1 Tax=Meristemomyces frigidus TaxID=1508187 RepID=A0AAN7YRJ4_9PEZI|nr:hypothetical protein LTR62_003835 [Meristemomyces frigidus]
MAEITTYTTTFNCARQLTNTDFLATSLLSALTTSALPPDLLVLSLQELAPISHSFLGGSLLTPYFSRITEAVALASSRRFGDEDTEAEYVPLITRNVGMTAMMVFGRHRIAHRVRWVQTAGVGVGEYFEMGNKGAVGVRLGMGIEGSAEEVVMTFVAAHLAPMEEKCARRNEDWRSICENLVFEAPAEHGGRAGQKKKVAGAGGEREPLLAGSTEGARDHGQKPSTLFTPPTHLLLSGDLNYRTSDTRPRESTNTKTWPQPVSSPTDANHYSHLLPYDQLIRERTANRTFHNLSEHAIAFPPTYKYSSAAQAQAVATTTEFHKLADGRTVERTSIQPAEEKKWLWAGHRTPSWCDRVLFLAAAKPTVHAYTSLPIQPTSDHRPVALYASFPAQPVEVGVGEVKEPFALREDWKQRRVVARRYEILIGGVAYLLLTWEGRALIFGTMAGVVGGYFLLAALVGMH